MSPYDPIFSILFPGFCQLWTPPWLGRSGPPETKPGPCGARLPAEGKIRLAARREGWSKGGNSPKETMGVQG
jgi:hypothetical protein